MYHVYMNGVNRLAEKQYTAKDIESIIYQQAVMKKVQDKIEVFIRHRVSSMCNFNLVNSFSSFNLCLLCRTLINSFKIRNRF